jgi:MFS transporter, PPP family, 3-phenylpropionic acid transporter
MKPFKDIQKVSLTVQFTLLYIGLTWMAFYAVFLEKSGFSSSQIGNLFGIFQATLLLVVPLWGMLADRFGNKQMFIITIAGSGIMMFFLPKTQNYHMLLLVMVVVSLFVHPLGSLIESLSISFCKIKKKASFGEFRMYGAIGWAAGSVVLGWLMDKYNKEIIFPYAMIFFGILLLISFLHKTDPPTKAVQGSFKLRDLKILMGNPVLMVFLFLIFLYGIATTPLNYFIALYYSEIGSNNRIIGTALMVQAITEIPFFFLGTQLVKRIGFARSMYIAVFFGFLRMLFYGLTGNPIVAVGIGALQGFSFSVFLVAAAEFVHEMVPQKLRATGQALLWAFHFGAGYSVGNIWIGAMRDKMNMQGVMIVEAVFTVLILGLLIVFFTFLHKILLKNYKLKKNIENQHK